MTPVPQTSDFVLSRLREWGVHRVFAYPGDGINAMPGAVYSSVGWSRPRVLPDPGELAKAAEILNAGSKVAILAGQGAAGARAELVEVAELLGAGVAKTLLGREVLPDGLPFVTGPIGLPGSMPSDEMVMNCDTFLMVGTSFPYAEWLPEEGSPEGRPGGRAVTSADAPPRGGP